GGAELRAYLNESCIVSDEPYYLPGDDEQFTRAVPFASIIVGKVAHALLRGVIKATAAQIGAAARQKDMYFVAAKDVDLYEAQLHDSPRHIFTDRLTCATIVAANFQPDNADCTHEYVPRVIPDRPIGDVDLEAATLRDDDSVENVLRRANVCLDGEARSVYEFRFEYSDDGTAFRVENAGLWMNALLSTDSRRAKRNVVYTIDLAEPAQNADMRILASAWMHLGQVSADMDSEQIGFAGRSEWLRVPPLGGPARAAYERDTAVHQDVYGEIEALERKVVRHRRTLDALHERLAAASENVHDAILKEMDDVEFRTLRAESLLVARRAEYDDLPQNERHYMPVTVRISVIESRSEKRALSTLAKHLDKNSKQLATVATDMMGFERSLGGPAVTENEPVNALGFARSNYYDALVAVEEAKATNAEALTEAEQTLQRTRSVYNEARRRAGIPEIARE
ncbi:MAG: hypothetical protein KJO31_14080, partial [Gammaproteobacteria bacterium]|nr:hypothetical protein [Gammaproteobacteria bacterium]